MHRTTIGLFAVALLAALVLSWGTHSSVGADPPTQIPAGFLPFLGGGQGDPDALTPVDPATPAAASTIPPGYLSFFGGGAGTGEGSGSPYGGSTPMTVSCE